MSWTRWAAVGPVWVGGLCGLFVGWRGWVGVTEPDGTQSYSIITNHSGSVADYCLIVSDRFPFNCGVLICSDLPSRANCGVPTVTVLCVCLLRPPRLLDNQPRLPTGSPSSALTPRPRTFKPHHTQHHITHTTRPRHPPDATSASRAPTSSPATSGSTRPTAAARRPASPPARPRPKAAPPLAAPAGSRREGTAGLAAQPGRTVVRLSLSTVPSLPTPT